MTVKMDEEEVKKVKSMLRSVLMSVKDGVLATRVQREFIYNFYIAWFLF